MSIWFPVTLALAIACVWGAIIVQSSKLFHAFCAKYPQEAQRLIPFAFSNSRHPEKLLFFFRKTSIPMLKADGELWKLRQQLKMLILLSFVVEALCVALLAFLAINSQH